MVIRMIFYYHKWESVRVVIDGLGSVNVAHLIQLQKTAFYRHNFTICTIQLLPVYFVCS